MWYDDTDYVFHHAFLNKVQSVWTHTIDGVFNSTDIALAEAKEHFTCLKPERISELEAEIARIKAED